MIRLLFLLASALLAAAPAAGQDEPAIIGVAGGPQSSLYSIFAEELQSYLQQEFPTQYEFQVLETVGSIENIERMLLDSDVMIAISQEDVAHYYYTGDNEFFLISREKANDTRITALGRIFHEQFYFVAQETTEVINEVGTINVGPRKSGTYATYTAFRDKHHPTWAEMHSRIAVDLFRSRQLDAFVEVEATPHLELGQLAEDGVHFNLMPVSRTDFSLGLDLYRNTTIPDSLSPTGEAIETISIPALLLCSRELPRDVAEAILRVFYDDDLLDESFPVSAWYLRQLPRRLRAGDGRPEPTDQRFRDLPLPPNPATVALRLGRFPILEFLGAIAAVVLLWLVWILGPRWRERHSTTIHRSTWAGALHRDVHFVLGAAFWITFAALGIKFLEIQHLLAGNVASSSQFTEMGVGKTVSWLIVFATSGYPQGGLPSDTAATYLAVSAKFLGIAVLVYAGARLLNVMVSTILERKSGMSFANLSGHIVICNWNSETRQLLEFLRAPDVPRDRRSRWIAVISDYPVSEQDLAAYPRIRHIPVPPWERRALALACLEKADSIMVLAPGDEASAQASDGIVLRTALAIASYLRGHEEYVKRTRRASIVAQARLTETKEYLGEIGISEAVIPRDTGLRLLAQTVVCPGITEAFREVLESAPDSNELHWCPIPRSLIAKKTTDFQPIVSAFGQTLGGPSPALPIGIRLAPRSQDERAESGYTLASRRQILINPTQEDFKSHGIDAFLEDDEVLVLSDEAPGRLP